MLLCKSDILFGMEEVYEDVSVPFDPARLLPYECRLEPDDPKVEKVPRAYRGSMQYDVWQKPMYVTNHP